MSRIRDAFTAARKGRRAALVTYVTAGDPGLEHTVELVRALRRGGADVVELGVPFTDPIADGPTNQRAAERALAAGTTLEGVLEAVREIRRLEEIPIVLFTYANPVVRFGVERFADEAAAAGVDGVLFTDVPVEELDRFRGPLTGAGIDPILLVAPTSTKERIRNAAKRGRGFLYLVSRTGVTGARTRVEGTVEPLVRSVKKLCKLPVAVGFGIADPPQVAAVARYADGVVVGSAIVRRIERLGASADLADSVQAFVTTLAEACRR